MPSPVTDTFQICTTQTIRMADFVRRSGRKTTQITDLSQSDPGMEVVEKGSKENSIWIFLFQDLSLEEKKNRKKKQRVLNNLHAKEDESSKFLSDFNPSSDRKAKAKVTGRYSAAPSSSAKKNSIYDNKVTAKSDNICDVQHGSQISRIIYCRVFCYTLVSTCATAWMIPVQAATSLAPSASNSFSFLFFIRFFYVSTFQVA